MPFAKAIVQGTEQVAAHTGATIGGLLNATFSNLPDRIIAMTALRAGLLEVVRAPIAGAPLASLLMALGLSVLLGRPAPSLSGLQPECSPDLLVVLGSSLDQPGAAERMDSCSSWPP
jgi:Ca2+/Na+ antiporter